MLREVPRPQPFQECLPVSPDLRESRCAALPQEFLNRSCAAVLPPLLDHLGRCMKTGWIPLEATHKQEEGGGGIGQASPSQRSHKDAPLPHSRSQSSLGGKRLAPHLPRTSEQRPADAHEPVYEPSNSSRLSERGRRSLGRAIPAGERNGPAGKLIDASVFASCPRQFIKSS